MRDPIKVAKAIMSFRTMNRLFINSSEWTKRFCCFLLRFTGCWGDPRHVHEKTADTGM